MSDDAPAPDTKPTEATPPADATPAKPPKKPGLLRPSGFILLIILILGAWASVPFVVEPWAEGAIRDGFRAMGLEASESTTVEVDVFGGAIRLGNLQLDETWKGETRTVLKAKEVTIDLSLADLIAGDIVIDRLAGTEVSGDLRRRGDGSIPLITPDEEETGEGIDWAKVDWYGYAKKAYEWWEQREREAKEAEEQAKQGKEPKLPPSQQRDEAWSGAKRYEPVLPPGRGPRVLIRDLAISGAGIAMPDDSAFEVTGFTLSGTNVCLIQLADETMTVQADLKTSGAGPITLNLTRKPGDDGVLTLAAPELPVAALADPRISGDSLSRYQPTGASAVEVAAQWAGSGVEGTVVSTVTGLDFTPPPGDSQAAQVHQVVSRLKGRPLTWPIAFGGTWTSPRITDSGIDDLVKGSLKDAATEAVKDEATKRATEEVNKQLEKNPEIKEATEKLNLPNPFKKK